MGKFWSLLFLLVPILGVGLFVWAPFNNHWLPRDVSTHGYQIDHLFNFILGLTGVVFIATELLLFWFLWRYDRATNTSPVKFTHGSHNLEIVWTILLSPEAAHQFFQQPHSGRKRVHLTIRQSAVRL